MTFSLAVLSILGLRPLNNIRQQSRQTPVCVNNAPSKYTLPPKSLEVVSQPMPRTMQDNDANKYSTSQEEIGQNELGAGNIWV
jgi:hypothetical protein